MCIECEAINAKIGHFRGLAKAVTDPMTLKGIDILVAKLEEHKAVLHRPGGRYRLDEWDPSHCFGLFPSANDGDIALQTNHPD